MQSTQQSQQSVIYSIIKRLTFPVMGGGGSLARQPFVTMVPRWIKKKKISHPHCVITPKEPISKNSADYRLKKKKGQLQPGHGRNQAWSVSASAPELEAAGFVFLFSAEISK